MALQHPQALYGTLDNSSILASQCLECFQTFVATDDLRAPIQNQEIPWWIAEKNLVMLPYCKLSKMLLSYRSTANMIQSQISIGQTIASEKNEAVALCIFTGAWLVIWSEMVIRLHTFSSLRASTKGSLKPSLTVALYFKVILSWFLRMALAIALAVCNNSMGVTTQLTRPLCSLCIYRLSC